MRLDASGASRLRTLIEISQKESMYLGRTAARLASRPLDEAWAARLPNDDDESELLDAFVSRFGRLQDTLGDKLIPALLGAASEAVGAQIDNLMRAEKLGWIASADRWIALRQLRNRLVHEYVSSPERLAQAALSAVRGVEDLKVAQERCEAFARDHGWT